MTERSVVFSKSGDGGLHWSAASVLPGSATVHAPADHPSITADPTDARFVYAIWDGTSPGQPGSAVFARTADGGLTWESARAIVQRAEQGYIQFSQIFVLPNMTLVNIYEVMDQQPNKPPTQTRLQLVRSTDRGQTWSAPINAVTMTPLYRPDGDMSETRVVDPKTKQQVQDPANASFAMDRNGNLYAVWEDGRFSDFQYNDIAFSMSADGLTWSAPVRVNRTPLTIPAANRQAFLPSIAVAADGTVGVSYYDFRFNDSKPGLPTDYWLVRCHPSATNRPSDSSCWGSEVRLTNSSFNMEAVIPNVPIVKNDFFVGDYFGLATADNDFVAVFTQVDNQNVTSIFARRVGP